MANDENNPKNNGKSNSTSDFEIFTNFMQQFSQFQAHFKQKTANHLSTEGVIEDSAAEIVDSRQDDKSNETVLVLTPDQNETLIALLRQPSLTAPTSVNHITSTTTLTQPK
ncbi:hypothetical protein PIB30_104449, partial [Stylosanthes scabra]|nr:hypothetical protein [Stylosanthes scabra]